MSDATPNRGDVLSVVLDPTIGREQAGIRPALVLKPPEGGLTMISFIKCEDIRSVSKQRLKKFHGRVAAQTMTDVELRLRILLDL